MGREGGKTAPSKRGLTEVALALLAQSQAARGVGREGDAKDGSGGSIAEGEAGVNGRSASATSSPLPPQRSGAPRS